MFIYKHWKIMAYSEKLSDIKALEKCIVYSTKSQYSIYISLNLSQKRALTQPKVCEWPPNSNLTCILWWCSTEWNCCIPSKVIDQKPQFSQNLSKKNAITQSKFRGLHHFETWPVFNDASPFCNVWMKLMYPFKSYQSETKNETRRTRMTLPP